MQVNKLQSMLQSEFGGLNFKIMSPRNLRVYG